jgi:hypothetical protein
MIAKRLLDVVSCDFKKKMFKERRSCGSNERPVKFLSTLDLLSYPKTLNYRKTVKSSSISLLVFMFRKGISQLLECDDCASFMSKYYTRNASRIYKVEPSEIRNVVMFFSADAIKVIYLKKNMLSP